MSFSQGFKDEITGRRCVDGTSTFQLEAAAATALHALTGIGLGVLLKKKFKKQVDSTIATIRGAASRAMEG